MAFCLLRIVKSQELFEQRLKELKSDYMIPRDYKDSVIKMLLKNHELSSWSPVPYNIAISCITYISYIAKSNINYNLSLENCDLQFAT